MLIYAKYLFIFLAFSLFARVDFSKPATVTGDAIPNLSKDGRNAFSQKITTDSSGRYVYAIWSRDNGTNFIVQVAISSNYGVDWTYPDTVTGDAIPNLSKDGGDAFACQIVTDSSGRWVYAIWKRNDGTDYIIQVAISSSYGANWTNPSTVTGDAIPNLSKNGGDAISPQIVTDSSGRWVYAIWNRDNGTNYIVQVAISSSYGADWTNPSTVTGDAIPNLSKNGGDATSLQIATDSSGRYVYAIWSRYDGTNFIVQVAISSSYGANWTNPSTVTGDAIPNLSKDGGDAFFVQIATDSSGKYVYAIWNRGDGNYIIQVSISSDNGVNWKNPDTVTGDAIPNLSKDGGDATSSQIATDSSGRYVYVIWSRDNGTNEIVQVSISSDNGVNWTNPDTVTGDAVPNLSKDGGDADYPQIATNSSGKYIYAIWQRDDGSYNIVQTVYGIRLGIHFPIFIKPKR